MRRRSDGWRRRCKRKPPSPDSGWTVAPRINETCCWNVRITTGNAWPSDRNLRQYRNLHQSRNRSIGNPTGQRGSAKRLVGMSDNCTPMISIHVRTIFKIGGEIVVRPTQMKYSILDSWLLSEKASCSAGGINKRTPSMTVSSRKRSHGTIIGVSMPETWSGMATNGQ